jgi:hypothetical protein
MTSVDVLPDGRFVAGGDQLTSDASQPAIWIGTLVQ